MSKENSRFLSLVLRHKPETIDIELDANGWVDVDILLEQLAKFKRETSYEELEVIVETNDKQRFTFNEDKSQIRANQGHSVDVDLGLTPEQPPEFLYHGTVAKALGGIFETGLDKMSRHALHLSEDLGTATNVGSRRGNPLILTIESGRMYKDGFEFFKSKNGVWLIDNVPPEYI